MKMSQYKKIVTACIAALSLLVQAGALAYAEEMIIDEGDPVVQEFPSKMTVADMCRFVQSKLG